MRRAETQSKKRIVTRILRPNPPVLRSLYSPVSFHFRDPASRVMGSDMRATIKNRQLQSPPEKGKTLATTILMTLFYKDGSLLRNWPVTEALTFCGGPSRNSQCCGYWERPGQRHVSIEIGRDERRTNS